MKYCDIGAVFGFFGLFFCIYSCSISFREHKFRIYLGGLGAQLKFEYKKQGRILGRLEFYTGVDQSVILFHEKMPK